MVYVDDARIPFGRMKMCHMYADTSEELLAMADHIGLNRKWIQYPGNPEKEHFDVSLSMRAKAIKAGAHVVDWRHWGFFKRNKTLFKTIEKVQERNKYLSPEFAQSIADEAVDKVRRDK